MWAAQTDLKHAEKVKHYLLKHHLLHPDYKLVKEFGLIFFPLSQKAKVPQAKVVDVKFSFPPVNKNLTAKELLKNKLTPQELMLLPQSQEIVGSILILEIPPELQHQEKIIAEAYLQQHKSIRTVVKKEHIHSGTYRTRTVSILAGKRTKETIHRENGVQIKLHLEKTYFSARLAHERMRIAQQVKKNEDILVMFSGAGPYVLVLARHSHARMIYAVEINPLAHRYAVDNLELNHVQHKVKLMLGDVHDIVPQLPLKFDRIVMPLPKTGEEFLDAALSKSKQGTIIHLYAFLNETEIKAHGQKVKERCKQLKHLVKIRQAVKCGQFSPGVFRVCFDLNVLK